MDSDINKNLDLSPKNKDIISFFQKDSSFVFIYKKTEKLASAVYIITNLFSDNEPIKWSLRKKVSDLVSFVLSYKDTKELGKNDFSYNLKSRVLELISLLEVSFRGGLISNMNYSVLKQEFSNLVDFIEHADLSQKEHVNNEINESFFESNLNKDEAGFSHKIKPGSEYYIKDNYQRHESVKDEIRKTNRQNIIINLIKKKKEVTIKDISQIIKDCSEKTIQRELISLISLGVLKRTGERRWSKYSLINPN